MWRWDQQEPFGDSAANEDPDGDSVTFSFPVRFPGQYYDVETNLAYNYFRDYDPPEGRYVQSDPIGLSGGVNTYLYVEAMPLNEFDPDGQLLSLWYAYYNELPLNEAQLAGEVGTRAAEAGLASGAVAGAVVVGAAGKGAVVRAVIAKSMPWYKRYALWKFITNLLVHGSPVPGTEPPPEPEPPAIIREVPGIPKGPGGGKPVSLIIGTAIGSNVSSSLCPIPSK